MARVQNNGRLKWRLPQAEVVKERSTSSQKLPKVPPKYCGSVYQFYSVYKLTNAFKCSRWRTYEVMVSVYED